MRQEDLARTVQAFFGGYGGDAVASALTQHLWEQVQVALDEAEDKGYDRGYNQGSIDAQYDYNQAL